MSDIYCSRWDIVHVRFCKGYSRQKLDMEENEVEDTFKRRNSHTQKAMRCRTPVESSEGVSVEDDQEFMIWSMQIRRCAACAVVGDKECHGDACGGE